MFCSPIRKLTYKSTAASMIPSSAFYLDFSETQASAMSPTLEAKCFAGTGHHFFHDKNSRADSKKLLETLNHPWEVIDSKSVGLKILDALSNEKFDKKTSKMDNRMVLFGSQLKVQIPSTSKNSSFRTATVESPQSLIEFGVKNKTSKLSVALLSPARKSSSSTLCLSASEMELSEDYTRVVSHGLNPKTTHIFDTCVMEDSNIGFNSMRREIKFSVDESNDYHSDDFLAFCDACRKKLGQGKDIFMYRGEQAFCSHECRSKQMLADNELENSAHCGRTKGFYEF